MPLMIRGIAVKNALVKSPALISSTFISSPVNSRQYHGLSNSKKSKCLFNCKCGDCKKMSDLAANTQGDRELQQYLVDEIQAEKQMVKMPKHGPGVPGFDVTTNGANVTLTRRVVDDKITVKFNVNGSVDTDADEGLEEYEQEATEKSQPPVGDMKSRPDFVVEIEKPSGKKMVFSCRLYGDQSHIDPAQAEDATKDDKFEIESFAVLNKDDVDEDGEYDDNVYAADGGLADGQMYDLLMNYLDERGITSDFADSLIDYATHYEHNQYVQLLDRLKLFVEGK